MIASETERQFYLGVAGVRLWYARDALPGAAPSPDYDFGEEPQLASPELQELVVPGGRPKAPTASVAPVPVRENGGKLDLRSLMASSGAPKAVPVQDLPVPVSEQAATEADTGTVDDDAPEAVAEALVPPPELDIHIWSGQGITLIAGVSADASLRLQETLAANILRSLGELSPRDLGQVHWPLFNNVRAPGNSLEDLRSVLKQLLSGVQGGRLVLIGTGSGAEEGLPWLDLIPDVVFPHTLAELAADAGLKRSLWQLIKPLAEVADAGR